MSSSCTVISEWKCTPEEKAGILDNSLYVQLTSPALIAADMVRAAVLFDKCFRPLRIICNCNGVDLPDWHPLKMAAVAADRIDEAFEAAEKDPMSIMDEEYECFSVASFPALASKVAHWKQCPKVEAIRHRSCTTRRTRP
jgi:hypothetical protein